MTANSTLETMVERVAWMSPIDYHILEFYDEYDIEASPKVVAENIGYERVYTGKRLKTLTASGLLVQEENGLYQLTDRGRAFLAGDLDAADLDEPA